MKKVQLGNSAGESVLTRYIRIGHKRVDGWLNAIAIDGIVQLASFQRTLQIRGGATEIGIHHGRLFILLHLLTKPPELSVAWDLFRRQQENVDASGCGDLETLKNNLIKHGCDLQRIKINTANSMRLTAPTILAECGGPVRLFSVDGGHTADTTYNDLSLASATLCAGGLVILDDFFNPDWPGVAEGASKYLFEHPNTLYPVAIIGNKFIFSNSHEVAEKYSRSLCSHYRRGYFVKTNPCFGGNAVTITPYGAPDGGLIDRALDYCGNSRIWESIRYTATGKFLKTKLRQIKDI